MFRFYNGEYDKSVADLRMWKKYWDFYNNETFPIGLNSSLLLNIPVGDLLYIATDEKDRSFFKPLSAYYRLYFFDDLLNKNILIYKNEKNKNKFY